MAETAEHLRVYANDWVGEIPMHIHQSEKITLGRDGTPAWHPDFARWLSRSGLMDWEGRGQRNPEERLRTTRAMRRLRRESIREFEVTFRVMVLGDGIANTTVWLNERAIRNGKEGPTHGRYTPRDTLALLVGGIDKIHHWH